jgi:hypothetical protein
MFISMQRFFEINATRVKPLFLLAGRPHDALCAQSVTVVTPSWPRI